MELEVKMSEVDRAILAIGIGDLLHRLPAPEAAVLRAELVSEFVKGHDRRFWWEALSHQSEGIQFSDGSGFTHIEGFVPDPEERCWFIVEDFESDDFHIYEATPELAVKIINECYGFEYYLVAKDRRWLICENHHNVVVGVGTEVVTAIKRFRA